MGLARRAHPYSEMACVAWARAGLPTLLLPYKGLGLRSLHIGGAEVCLDVVRGGCIDISGPVAHWSAPPPGDVSGRARYQVLPYKGAPPRIDGKALEPEWKGSRLWIHTAAMVAEGLEAWGGPADASSEWTFRSRGAELLFFARVHDDRVLAGTDEEQNDALGLEIGMNVRFILGPEGRVHPVGVAHARCAWARAPGGYGMECAIALADLKESRPPAVWNLNPLVEDRDGPGQPLKTLSSSNEFYAWSEFPPLWSEASWLGYRLMDYSEED